MSTHITRRSRAAALLLFTLAFTVRIAAAGLSHGFDNDTACFAAWADRMFLLGPGHFYSPDFFADYPPGYLYLLYPVGALRALLGIGYYSTAHLILLRLPAILCDLGCGFLLYREAAKRLPGPGPLFLCAAYLLNPAVLLNSSVWGQADSVYTLLLLLLCLSLAGNRWLPACLSFTLGLLVKPQMLIFAPVLFAGFLDRIRRDTFSAKIFLQSLGQGLAALLCALAAALPFGLANVAGQYLNTVQSYPYAAVNAWNFWGLLGRNWVGQDEPFLGIPGSFYGWAAILAAVLTVLYLSLRRPKDTLKYPLLAALLMATVFLFSVRMHERYLFPVLALLLLACAFLRSGRLFLCYCGFSLLHFGNTAQVLFFYDPTSYDRHSPLILLGSAGMLALLVFLYRSVFLHWSSRNPGLSGTQPLPPVPSRPKKPVSKTELLCVAALTLAYGCFALHDLGDRQAPSSSCRLNRGDRIELDLGSLDPAEITGLAMYIGPAHDRTFTLQEQLAGGTMWHTTHEIVIDEVFTWQLRDISLESPRLCLTLESDQAILLELVFTDSAGKAVTPVNAGEYPCLFDEQSLFPERFSFRNSMYFDEIYHGRTAYEFLKGLPAYETTHPPLGKILIAAGIAVFGMNPFGWRIAGALCGIAMVPLAWLFARRMTRHTLSALLATVFFAFDFMHFTQTRLATIDVFITFFVLLMYLFLYRYCTLSFYDVPLSRTLLPLGACGVCMGLGIAAKWTGVYAGVGLTILFFGSLFRRYREYLSAKQDPNGCTGNISHRHILESFRPCVLKTLLFCCLFFLLIPAAIYLVSYLPFSDGSGDGVLLRMLRNQEYMFRYHSGLDAIHPFSSPWYQWPILKRPVWYYSGILTGSYGTGGLREGISAFGNPLVWWMGIPAAFCTLWLSTRKKDRTAAFLLTGYLAQYLPWFFVTRITFIYHYFPSVIFVVLMSAHCLDRLRPRLSKRAWRLLNMLFATSALGLFLLFYPVLSGQPVEASYVNRFLRWFEGWVLTAK